MPPSILDGFCNGMALRRASLGGLIERSFGSPPQTSVTEETGSKLPCTSITSDNDAPKILSVLSATLDYLIARNEQDFPMLRSAISSTQTGSPMLSGGHVDRKSKLGLFHGLRVPNIGVQKYLERIYKYTNCSPSCFVVAYAYMDRLVHRQPDQPIISLNVHRLIITSVMVAAKMLDDIHYNNAFYARVGGVSISELNRMELELLFQLDFRLSVTTHTFESYCVHLEREFCNLGRKPMIKGLPAFRKTEELSSAKKPLHRGDGRIASPATFL